MRKKAVVAIMGMLTAIIFFSSCTKTGGFTNSTAAINATSEPVSQVSSDTISQPAESSGVTPTEDINEDIYTEYLYILENTKRVGAEGKGFVDVPEDWVEFVDIVPNTDFQYSDITGQNIITMNQISFEGMAQEEIDQLTLEAIANEYFYDTQQRFGDEITSMDGYIIDINGLESYQIITLFQDKSVLIKWVVQAEDGNYYVINAEGSNQFSGELITLVEKTYDPFK